MSPFQHGEVYVTADGAETDLDLGHYERFIDEPMSKLSTVTTGQIYQSVLNRERRGDFLGRTIQIVPHITDAIKERIVRAAEESAADILNTVRLIAAELGLKKEGERLAKRLGAQAPRKAPEKPLKVYIEADAGGWTTGGLSFISDAVRLAGGRNIFGGEKRGYFQASWEETLLLDPEAVILLAGTAEEFAARPMAKDLAAVKAGRVITTLDRDAFSRPGPRLFSEIERLRKILDEKK